MKINELIIAAYSLVSGYTGPVTVHMNRGSVNAACTSEQRESLRQGIYNRITTLPADYTGSIKFNFYGGLLAADSMSNTVLGSGYKKNFRAIVNERRLSA